jgi:hypothetical protein
LNAKEGEMIPAGNPGAGLEEWPRMHVTFRVEKAYKGDLGSEVEISTGLGGGDCGAVYTSGLPYLIFARGPSLRELSVNRCSPGGWIGGSDAASELRYLRGERPVPIDLLPFLGWYDKGHEAEQEKRRRQYEGDGERFEAITGKICGKAAIEDLQGSVNGTISFLSVTGYSPLEHPMVGVDSTGSFCSGRLGPGKYYLYYERGTEKRIDHAVYYPGVSDRRQATTVEILPGQSPSDISFHIPNQKTFSVRGIISIDDKSGLRDAKSRSLSLA